MCTQAGIARISNPVPRLAEYELAACNSQFANNFIIFTKQNCDLNRKMRKSLTKYFLKFINILKNINRINASKIGHKTRILTVFGVNK